MRLSALLPLVLLAACSSAAPAPLTAARLGTDVTSPDVQTFMCRQIETMNCSDPAWCEDSYHCTLKIWLSSPNPEQGYVGVSSQVHGAGDWRIYDTWNPNIYTQAERVGVSGYVFQSAETRNKGHMGGDFGVVITHPSDHDSPDKTGVALNNYNAWADPGPLGYRGGIAASLILGGTDGGHGSAAVSAHTPISESVRWYRLLHAAPKTLHPDTIGGIWFERSGPANFVTIQPEDDTDADAMRIADSGFTRLTSSWRKSGRWLGSTPYACMFPTFSFIQDERSGICLVEDALGLAVNGTAQISVTEDAVTIAAPAVFKGGILAPNLGKPPAAGPTRAACFDKDGRLFQAVGKVCP